MVEMSPFIFHVSLAVGRDPFKGSLVACDAQDKHPDNYAVSKYERAWSPVFEKWSTLLSSHKLRPVPLWPISSVLIE